MEKIMAAMSGGVDSTYAALLLIESGYEVCGGTLLMHDMPSGRQTVIDAKEAAAGLGIEHYTIDVRNEFKKSVMDYFADDYIAGRTPNPCVRCNRTVKFPLMQSAAHLHGCDKIATGHYAQVEYDDASGRWLLKKGADLSKDQSYFLYSLSQEMLSKTLFPIGKLTKKEVRELAAERKLRAAVRTDSQDVCFLDESQDYRAFIERQYGYKPLPGDFVDESGKVLGQHEGALCYTIGQRRGLGVSADSRLYVLGKSMETNRVTLGRESGLLTKSVSVNEINLVAADHIDSDFNCGVKLRYSRGEFPARVIVTGENTAIVELDSPQRSPAAGQAAVFYDGDTVIGGGTII